MLVSPRPATSQLLSLERPTRRFSNRPGVKDESAVAELAGKGTGIGGRAHGAEAVAI